MNSIEIFYEIQLKALYCVSNSSSKNVYQNMILLALKGIVYPVNHAYKYGTVHKG